MTNKTYYSHLGGNYDGVSQYDTIETAPINNILYSDIIVEFTFKCESTPANYSSHPVWWGEPGFTDEWIFIVYYFGSDSDGYNNRIQVAGSVGGSFPSLSATSIALTVGTTYKFKWVYNSVLGGQLYLDGLAVGGRVGSGSLNTKVGNIYIARNPKTYGGGRPHNFFDGDVTDISVSRKVSGRISQSHRIGLRTISS